MLLETLLVCCAVDSAAPLLPEHVHNHLLVSFELQGFVFLARYNNIVNSSSHKTGELEGPEVDGFVKDMMELVKVPLDSLIQS
ncbi:hypothetical protein F7725_025541 [Dissostichus mawsoni]|uniref:Uncharacterized protein n=1 Tax=Dissostichus mawsoni TaxID=36200 RepID=A0A7J5XCQ5_DISMA|nr:hypothetical protein F7725_025541 [Dissostichus mawsoni]